MKSNEQASDPATEASGKSEYEAPAIESVVTHDDLEREVAYAGTTSQTAG